jgi:hypothetical protein
VVSIAAGAVALASSGSAGQFSGPTQTVSNRLFTPPNTGPNHDGNSGALLLRLPGFGDLTITRCALINGFFNDAIVSYHNTSGVPVDILGEFPVFGGTFVPGQTAVLQFFTSQGGPVKSNAVLAAGQGPQRRVATMQMGNLFGTAGECTFDAQATAQFASNPEEG